MATPEEIQSLKEARELSKSRREQIQEAAVTAGLTKQKSAESKKVSGGQLLEMGLDIAAGAGAGGAIGFAAGGPPGAATGALWGAFFPAAATAAFGVPGEDERSTQRAGTAANVGQIVSRLPEIMGKAALPKPARIAAQAGAVGLEQYLEGAEPTEALERTAFVGALPERLDDIFGSVARHGSRMRKRISDFIFPVDSTDDVLAVMKAAPDPRFEPPRSPVIGEKLSRDSIVVEAVPTSTRGANRYGATRGTSKLIFKADEIQSFKGVSTIRPKAAAAMFKDPIRFAAALQSIEDPGTQAAVRTEWFLDNVMKNPKRLDPGQLTDAMKKFGEPDIQAALGPNFMNRIGDIETAMKFAPPPKTLGGKARSNVQYIQNRAQFDFARAALGASAGAGAAGGGFALGGSPAVISIGIGALLYGSAISPPVTKLLAAAAKENNILKTRALYNELIQLGFREIPGEDGNAELVPPANTISNPRADFMDMMEQSSAAGAF